MQRRSAHRNYDVGKKFYIIDIYIDMGVNLDVAYIRLFLGMIPCNKVLKLFPEGFI